MATGQRGAVVADAEPGYRVLAGRAAGAGLTGLLPDGVSTVEGQLARLYAQYRRQPDDLAKNLYLASLRDRNEVLLGSSQDTAETGNRMILM